MLYQEEKVFRYRYEFRERRLRDFIRERYFRNHDSGQLSDILSSRVRLNGQAIRPDTTVRRGDWIEYRHRRSDEDELELDLPVIYEDEWLLAIAKPDFLPVIPNSRYYFNSLAIHIKEKYGNEAISPVHRLDIETSGVLLFGKSRDACSGIQRLFRERQVEKRYEAVSFEKPALGTISGTLIPATDSKIYTKLLLDQRSRGDSQTVIERCKPWGRYFWLQLKPLSGKTNQIRAHLAAIGCPIVGDKKYYPDEAVFLDWFLHRDISRIIDRLKLPRQALHCQSLSFVSPFDDRERHIADQTSAWPEKIAVLNDPDH